MDLHCDLEIRHYIQISSEIDTGRGEVWESFHLASLLPETEGPCVACYFDIISTLFRSFLFSQPSRRIVYYPLVLLHHPSGTRPKLNLKGWAGEISLLSLSLSHLRSNALQCSNDEHI